MHLSFSNHEKKPAENFKKLGFSKLLIFEDPLGLSQHQTETYYASVASKFYYQKFQITLQGIFQGIAIISFEILCLIIQYTSKHLSGFDHVLNSHLYKIFESFSKNVRTIFIRLFRKLFSHNFYFFFFFFFFLIIQHFTLKFFKIFP